MSRFFIPSSIITSRNYKAQSLLTSSSHSAAEARNVKSFFIWFKKNDWRGLLAPVWLKGKEIFPTSQTQPLKALRLLLNCRISVNDEGARVPESLRFGAIQK